MEAEAVCSGAFATFAGFLIGLLDSQPTETGFIAVMLLAFGFYIAFAEPSVPWLKGILVAIFIPLLTLVRWKTGLLEPEVLRNGFGSFLAFVPALAGAYGGAFARNMKERLARPAVPEQNASSQG